MGHNKPSDDIALLGVIDPDAYATGAFNTDWCAAEYFNSFFAVCSVGIIVTSGTVDFKLQQATSSTGAGSKDITSANITQLTTGDNDEQSWINIRADQLDVANNFDFIRGVMTVTTAGADSAAYIYGYKAESGPASGHDLASVGEIVTV